MDGPKKIMMHIGEGGMILASVFLAGVMSLIVINVVMRFFGKVILGAYELIELSISVTIAFALGYTALHKGHIFIRLLVTRLKVRTRAIIESFTLLICIFTWAIMAWSGTKLMLKRGTGELTELLEVPYLPFRLIFSLGLIFFCIVLLVDLINSLKQVVKK